jgi:hypothetical protein
MNIDQITEHSNGDYRQVQVVIGGTGKEYDSTQAHFEVSGVHSDSTAGQLKILMPDSVAEYFRQQGRRQLRREINLLLNP